MFIATMFSYGSDTDAVGVDGIQTCIGLFLDTGARFYAIHIPFQPQHYVTARNAFVGYVNLTEPHFDRAAARLYAVINGTYRNEVYREVLDYGLALGGVRRFKIVRVSGLMTDSAAIILERIPFNNERRLKYLRAGSVRWQHGVGTVRSGFYHNGSMQDVLSVDTNLSHGWRVVDDSNASIATTNW